MGRYIIIIIKATCNNLNQPSVFYVYIMLWGLSGCDKSKIHYVKYIITINQTIGKKGPKRIGAIMSGKSHHYYDQCVDCGPEDDLFFSGRRMVLNIIVMMFRTDDFISSWSLFKVRLQMLGAVGTGAEMTELR